MRMKNNNNMSGKNDMLIEMVQNIVYQVNEIF